MSMLDNYDARARIQDNKAAALRTAQKAVVVAGCASGALLFLRLFL